MEFTATQIAQILQGVIEGPAETSVKSFGKIEEATASQLAFLANPKYEDFLYTTQASIIIINKSQILKKPISSTLIRVDDAYTAFAKLLELYQQLQVQELTGIQEPSYIHPTAVIGKDVFIGAFAYVGEHATIGDGAKVFPNAYVGNRVSIGNNSVIHSGVKIYHDCKIGVATIIHAGSIIGSDGFGFAPQNDGTYKKVPQLGNVVIEDHVEIGANTTIDRATIGSTLIRTGAKLDNLIQVAHNVEIGNNTVIAAQTGISGSTKIGKNVMIGGQAGIGGHLQIADGTKVSGKSGVTKSIKKPNTAVTGNPAFELKASLKNQAMVRNLPRLEQKIKALEELVSQLSKKD